MDDRIKRVIDDINSGKAHLFECTEKACIPSSFDGPCTIVSINAECLPDTCPFSSFNRQVSFKPVNHLMNEYAF